MPHLRRAIGERMAWEWGALWTIDRDAGVLRCEHIWHAPSLEAATFDAISRQTAGLPGRGLKGRVWQSAEPTWMADVTQDPHFMRATIAARMGLQGAVAFPILRHGETLGIMEFFSRAIPPPDEAQLPMLSAMGNQIGQFVERKRAEEQLRRSEAYLAEGQSISHTGSWAVKFPSEDVFWSPEVYRLYGLDPATTKRSQPMAFQLIHPDDRPFVKEAFERALRENSDYAVEHRAILPDGSIKHLHALRASEVRFRDLVEGSIQGVIVHRHFQPLFVNPAYAELFSYTPAEILAMDSLLELLGPHERTRLQGYHEGRLCGAAAPAYYECEGVRIVAALCTTDLRGDCRFLQDGGTIARIAFPKAVAIAGGEL
jgi:PAS domain-containing protein